MMGTSHLRVGLITGIAVAVSFVALAIPASAATGPCSPPPNADGWYCGAIAMNDASQRANAPTGGVTDRLVDDYFRDAIRTSSPTSDGFVDDSWRGPVVATAEPTPGGFVDDSWRTPVAPVTVTTGPSGFAWGDFGIGVAAAFGAMILALGLGIRFVGTRRPGVRSA